MQKMPLTVLILPAANDKLVLLQRHIELIAGESGHSERKSQPFGFGGAARQTFDILGRIAVRGVAGDPAERLFDLVEAQKKRRIQRWSRHVAKPWIGASGRSPDGRSTAEKLYVRFVGGVQAQPWT